MINLSIIWDVNPVLFEIGGFELRYYSLAWMLGFYLCVLLMNKMLKSELGDIKLTDSMFMYCFISTIVGARLGHCLFYETSYYLTHPFEILNLRQGGLASHGAALGLLVGIYLFSKKHHLTYIWSLDRITAVIPLGGAIIRIGNLMNSEIYGTPTTLPWGFIFVRNRETIPMHPTQIYEALAYILILGLLMYLFFCRKLAERHPGAMFGIFLITLFGSRFFVETIKNVQESFEETMILNMGQILSIPFVLGGIALVYLAYNDNKILRK